MVLHRVPGDGNCQFHAVSDQLKERYGIEVTHLKLRQQAVEYLRRRHDLYAFVSANFKSWDTYIAHMKEPRSWGDENTLMALSNIYSMYIHVLFESDKNEREISDIEFGKDFKHNKEIYLLCYAEMHYESLRPGHAKHVQTPHIPDDMVIHDLAKRLHQLRVHAAKNMYTPNHNSSTYIRLLSEMSKGNLEALVDNLHREYTSKNPPKYDSSSKKLLDQLLWYSVVKGKNDTVRKARIVQQHMHRMSS